MIPRHTVTKDNVHIFDSWRVSKKDFQDILVSIDVCHPECEVFKKRNILSIELEWAVHNFLYNIGAWEERTKDVDINYPLKWYARAGYAIFGVFAWLLIK